MLVKVSELKGRALNYAVAVCEWGEPEISYATGNFWWNSVNGLVPNVLLRGTIRADEFNPQGNWAHGGPLIDKYDIWLMSNKRGVTGHTWWRAYPLGGVDNQNLTAYHRPLRAAMISLVWFKHGSDEIEIPDILMG